MKRIINNRIIKRTWLKYFLIITGIYSSFYSCNKYLDAKPDQSIATPSTIEDLEGIINNYNFINARYPSASEVSSDDFYLSPADWSSLNERQRNFYTWQKYDDIGGDYTAPYSAIEYANIVLDALPKISGAGAQRKNAVRGNALFIRASYHYALAQLFAKAYDKATAGADLGIALRLSSDIAQKPVRSTVAETYNSVLTDLKTALPLLPARPEVKYKASKAAAYGMLARVYLSMSDYSNAGLCADSALGIYNKLIDYNSVDPSATIPFAQFNDEVIYDARTSPPQALSTAKAAIDTALYESYDADDLRKTVLFRTGSNGKIVFKGNYTGLNNASLFTGIATNELYFIKAEAAARNGSTAIALQALNTILADRYTAGTYVPYSSNDPAQLVSYILQQRRKELLFRTLRWTDLRRLNMESSRAVVLTRNVNNTSYKLEPGSLRYVFEIDQNAVHYSGLTQNP